MLLYLSQILERGFHPEGVGRVIFTCPVVKKMPPVLLEDCGRIKRIRGIVYPKCYNDIMECVFVCVCTCTYVDLHSCMYLHLCVYLHCSCAPAHVNASYAMTSSVLLK